MSGTPPPNTREPGIETRSGDPARDCRLRSRNRRHESDMDKATNFMKGLFGK